MDLAQLENKMKQKIEQTQIQKLDTELSYKIMQIGQAVLQVEEEYLPFIKDDELKQKIKTASKLLKEIAEQMEDYHAERMINWHKYIRRKTQQGFI